MQYIVILMLLLVPTVCLADAEYDARMERIGKWRDEEIAREHELKVLALEYKILAMEYALQRSDNMLVNTSSNEQSTGVTSTMDVDVDTISQQVVRQKGSK